MIPTQTETMSSSGNPTPISAYGHLGVHWKSEEYYGEALSVLVLVLHPFQTLFHQN